MVSISDETHMDLEEIYNYIAKDSLYYAEKTTVDIYSLIYELEESPYLGRYVPELDNKNFLEVLYKSYRIVYEIKDESIIYVHFVLHGKRDFNSFYKTYINQE